MICGNERINHSDFSHAKNHCDDHERWQEEGLFEEITQALDLLFVSKEFLQPADHFLHGIGLQAHMHGQGSFFSSL